MHSDGFQTALPTSADEPVHALERKFRTAICGEVRRRLTEPRLLRVVSEAEVCQLVLTELTTGLTRGRLRFEGPRQLRAWIRKATANHVRKVAEKAKAQRRDVRRLCLDGERELRAVQDRTPDPSRITEGRDLLRWTLERLPPELRELALQRGAGRTWSELATEFGGTADALRKRLTRALDELLDTYSGILAL
jgi:RNA polymerase sigma factor (sigma-70 family)